MNTAYPLIPVSVITILAYFTTLLFARWEIFSVKSHRKFWNILLLVTFLVSGLLGLLSVIKVNYKLEIPNYDQYMQWHVAFGIGMVFISFFHLSWHLKYYFTFQEKKTLKNLNLTEYNENNPDLLVNDETTGKIFQTPFDYAQGDRQTERSRSLFLLTKRLWKNNSEKFRILLILLGAVAIISQVVFIREFISVLTGNELVLGVVMAAWMLLTGWGALTGRKGNFSKLTFKRGITMLSTLSFLPVLLIGLLYWFKNLLFPPGTMVSIGVSVTASFLLLFPVCFLSGYLFTAFSTLYSESKNENLTGKAYAFESLGSLLGGLIFSIILGRFFNSFQIFGITTAVILIAGAFIIQFENKGSRLIIILFGLAISALIFIFNPDNHIKKMQFPNQEMVANRSTRYGNLVITKQAGQLNVYENNDLQFYTENLMMNEESVHFAMVQHKNPQYILLVSGGISGMIQEINKYKVEKITYLEINPEIFSSLKEFVKPDLNFGNVEIVKLDIRTFIGKPGQKYDVILLNLPPPSSLGINRFFTDEFFQNLKKHCNDKTVVCTSLPSTANYAEENALEVNSSLWNTLGIHFSDRLLLQGEKNYFVASNQPLSSNITKLMAEKGIENEYVNQYYFDDNILKTRSETLTREINPETPVNRDFSPFMFIRQIDHWLSHFGTNYKILALIPLALFILFSSKLNRVTAGLYTGGFTAASLEVVLMLAYQIYFGSLYIATAFFFAVFMAGMALGSSIGLKPGFELVKSYFSLQFGLAAFAVVLPFLILIIGNFTGWKLPVQFLLFELVFALALAVGFEFLLASKIRQSSYSETSGVNYSTDLAGSAFGAFLTAIVLLPLLGLVYTCFILAALNILSGSLAFSIRKTSIF
jgi:spermidine synthase